MQIPTLQTERLTLRPISVHDIDDLFAFSYFNGKPISTRNGIAEKLVRIEKEIAAGNSLHWGMELKSRKKLIGAAGFYRGFPNNTGEIGYALDPAFEKQGFMREAVAEIMKYGFETLNLNQIIAYTKETNPASINVLRHTGFRETVSDLDIYKKFVNPGKPTT